MPLASRRPADHEWTKPYHGEMIATVKGDDVFPILESQMYWLCELASHLPTVSIDVVHKPYGWTIRQVFEHGVDCERVFGYRMLRLAAGDKTPIPGFDENAYANARFGLGNFSNLVSEWGDCRKANLHLLRRMSPACWDHQAQIDGDLISLRAVAWVCAAHLQRHLDIVEKRVNRRVARCADDATCGPPGVEKQEHPPESME